MFAAPKRAVIGAPEIIARPAFPHGGRDSLSLSLLCVPVAVQAGR